MTGRWVQIATVVCHLPVTRTILLEREVELIGFCEIFPLQLVVIVQRITIGGCTCAIVVCYLPITAVLIPCLLDKVTSRDLTRNL